jgi:hypothetical protein
MAHCFSPLLIRGIGNSIASNCLEHKVRPPREPNHSGLVLVKQKYYLLWEFLWSEVLNDAISSVPRAVDADRNEVPFGMLGVGRPADWGSSLDPFNVTNLGPQPRETWEDLLARSKFLVSHALGLWALMNFSSASESQLSRPLVSHAARGERT